MDTKICTKCGRELPTTMFYMDKSHTDGLASNCKECKKPYFKTYYGSNKDKWKIKQEKNKQIVEDSKTECKKCGEERRYLIQYHHVNPDNKSFALAEWGTHSEKKIIEEISKCICLCANCHMEFHYLYGKQPIKPEESLNEYLT